MPLNDPQLTPGDLCFHNEDGTQTIQAQELIVGDIFDSQDGLTHRVKRIRTLDDGTLIVVIDKLEDEPYPASFRPTDPVTIL